MPLVRTAVRDQLQDQSHLSQNGYGTPYRRSSTWLPHHSFLTMLCPILPARMISFYTLDCQISIHSAVFLVALFVYSNIIVFLPCSLLLGYETSRLILSLIVAINFSVCIKMLKMLVLNTFIRSVLNSHLHQDQLQTLTYTKVGFKILSTPR